MKRKIYTEEMLQPLRNYLIRECSKFISGLPLKTEDIDCDFEIDCEVGSKTLTLIGLTNDSEYPIAALEKATGFYYAVSKDTFKTGKKNI